MSESRLAKIIDSIGRLKLGDKATAFLTALAILKDKPPNPPGWRWLRWVIVTTLSVGAGYWQFS